MVKVSRFLSWMVILMSLMGLAFPTNAGVVNGPDTGITPGQILSYTSPKTVTNTPATIDGNGNITAPILNGSVPSIAKGYTNLVGNTNLFYGFFPDFSGSYSQIRALGYIASSPQSSTNWNLLTQNPVFFDLNMNSTNTLVGPTLGNGGGVTEYKGAVYMVYGSTLTIGTVPSPGQLIIASSTDLTNWSYIGSWTAPDGLTNSFYDSPNWSQVNYGGTNWIVFGYQTNQPNDGMSYIAMEPVALTPTNATFGQMVLVTTNFQGNGSELGGCYTVVTNNAGLYEIPMGIFNTNNALDAYSPLWSTNFFGPYTNMATWGLEPHNNDFTPWVYSVSNNAAWYYWSFEGTWISYNWGTNWTQLSTIPLNGVIGNPGVSINPGLPGTIADYTAVGIKPEGIFTLQTPLTNQSASMISAADGSFSGTVSANNLNGQTVKAANGIFNNISVGGIVTGNAHQPFFVQDSFMWGSDNTNQGWYNNIGGQGIIAGPDTFGGIFLGQNFYSDDNGAGNAVFEFEDGTHPVSSPFGGRNGPTGGFYVNSSSNVFDGSPLTSKQGFIGTGITFQTNLVGNLNKYYSMVAGGSVSYSASTKENVYLATSANPVTGWTLASQRPAYVAPNLEATNENYGPSLRLAVTKEYQGALYMAWPEAVQMPNTNGDEPIHIDYSTDGSNWREIAKYFLAFGPTANPSGGVTNLGIANIQWSSVNYGGTNWLMVECATNLSNFNGQVGNVYAVGITMNQRTNLTFSPPIGILVTNTTGTANGDAQIVTNGGAGGGYILFLVGIGGSSNPHWSTNFFGPYTNAVPWTIPGVNQDFSTYIMTCSNNTTWISYPGNAGMYYSTNWGTNWVSYNGSFFQLNPQFSNPIGNGGEGNFDLYPLTVFQLTSPLTNNQSSVVQGNDGIFSDTVSAPNVNATQVSAQNGVFDNLMVNGVVGGGFHQAFYVHDDFNAGQFVTNNGIYCAAFGESIVVGSDSFGSAFFGGDYYSDDGLGAGNGGAAFEFEDGNDPINSPGGGQLGLQGLFYVNAANIIFDQSAPIGKFGFSVPGQGGDSDEINPSYAVYNPIQFYSMYLNAVSGAPTNAETFPPNILSQTWTYAYTNATLSFALWTNATTNVLVHYVVGDNNGHGATWAIIPAPVTNSSALPFEYLPNGTGSSSFNSTTPWINVSNSLAGTNFFGEFNMTNTIYAYNSQGYFGNASFLTNDLRTLVIPVSANRVISSTEYSAMTTSNLIYNIDTSGGNVLLTLPAPTTNALAPIINNSFFSIVNYSTNAITVTNGPNTTIVVANGQYTNVVPNLLAGYFDESVDFVNLNATNWLVLRHHRTLNQIQSIAQTALVTNALVTPQANVTITGVSQLLSGIGFAGLTQSMSCNVMWTNSAATQLAMTNYFTINFPNPPGVTNPVTVQMTIYGTNSLFTPVADMVLTHYVPWNVTSNSFTVYSGGAAPVSSFTNGATFWWHW